MTEERHENRPEGSRGRTGWEPCGSNARGRGLRIDEEATRVRRERDDWPAESRRHESPDRSRQNCGHADGHGAGDRIVLSATARTDLRARRPAMTRLERATGMGTCACSRWAHALPAGNAARRVRAPQDWPGPHNREVKHEPSARQPSELMPHDCKLAGEPTTDEMATDTGLPSHRRQEIPSRGRQEMLAEPGPVSAA
jgi:hypothetical protein